MKKFFVFSAIYSVFLLVGLLPCNTLAQEAELFRFHQGEAAKVAFSIATIDARRVEIDHAPLEVGAEVLSFVLLDGIRYDARLSDLEHREPGDVTWRGWLDVANGDRVVLTLKKGVVAGLIHAPDALYEIGPLRNGGQALAKLDQSLFPECAIGPDPVGERRDDFQRRDDSQGLPAITPNLIQIDVMCLYTPQARIGAGGVAGIESTIQAAVDNANTAFIDSNMTARFNLVHTQETGRSESGNISADLNWLRSSPDVAGLRNFYAADMVGLIVENGGGFCGIASVMRNPGSSFQSSAFQVTARGCAVGNLTYAHEHGHNMGFEHDPANGAPPNVASYPWSFGHNVSGVFRTVMSYQCPQGCTRVPHFSNPDVTQSGFPTGIAGHRDNHRTGDLTAPIVADFRSKDVINSAPPRPALVVQVVPPTTLGQVGRTALRQNFPNPFNPETWIPYDLEADALVLIHIYNGQGKLVRQLYPGAQEAGRYLDKGEAAYWDGKDQFGHAVSSGTYFYTLKAGTFQATRKMIILK